MVLRGRFQSKNQKSATNVEFNVTLVTGAGSTRDTGVKNAMGGNILPQTKIVPIARGRATAPKLLSSCAKGHIGADGNVLARSK